MAKATKHNSNGLPEGWKMDKVGNISSPSATLNPTIEQKKKFTYLDISSVNNETFLVEEPKEIYGKEAPSRARKSAPKESILFATTRPNLKNVAIVQEDYKNPVASTGFCVLEPHNQKVITRYLFYFLITNNVQEQIKPWIRGAQYPAISDKDVFSLQIPLPPLFEQRRIVARLDALFEKTDKAIALTTENIEHTRHLLPAALNEVFGESEENCKSKKLEDVAKIISGYAFSSKDFSINNKIKSIKITNVGVGEFIETEEYLLPQSYINEFKTFIVRSGDIVISLTRSVINDGLKVCLVPKTYDNSLLNQRVAAIKEMPGNSCTEYIYYYLRTPKTLEYVLEKSRTMNQPNLSIKDLYNLSIPLPDLPTQQRIVSYLNQLSQRQQQLLQHYEKQMQQLQQLKASLLDGAFRGEV